MASRFAAVGTPEPTLSTSAEPVTEDTSEPESESTSAPSTSIASVSKVTPECQDPLYTYELMGSVWRLHAHASVRRRCIMPTEFQKARESSKKSIKKVNTIKIKVNKTPVVLLS